MTGLCRVKFIPPAAPDQNQSFTTDYFVQFVVLK